MKTAATPRPDVDSDRPLLEQPGAKVVDADVIATAFSLELGSGMDLHVLRNVDTRP